MPEATDSTLPQTTEILLPDPKLRRNVLRAVLAGVLLGVASIGWFLPWVQRSLLLARANGTLTLSPRLASQPATPWPPTAARPAPTSFQHPHTPPPRRSAPPSRP